MSNKKKTPRGLIRADMLRVAKHYLLEALNESDVVSIDNVQASLMVTSEYEPIDAQFEADFDATLTWLDKQISKLEVPK